MTRCGRDGDFRAGRCGVELESAARPCMSFWLRAASLPDRPPMAVNLLSMDVMFLGGHRGAVRSVQQFWGLRACARSAGVLRRVLEA